MAYGEDLQLEVEGDVAFLGLCLDSISEEPQWLVVTAKTLEELKTDMRSNGYNLEYSQILRIKLPDISHIKKVEENIKILDVGEIKAS